MASRDIFVKITADPRPFLSELERASRLIALKRLSQLLGISMAETQDWLIAKVAQFRGISEADALALIEGVNEAEWRSGSASGP